MNSDNLARIAGRIYRYIRDPMPHNQHDDAIWCLGRQYDSHPTSSDPDSTQPQTPPAASIPAPSATSDSIPPDSAATPQKEDEFEKVQVQEATNDNGWPPAFLDDLESRIWLTYRTNFSQIAESTDPAASAGYSWKTHITQLVKHGRVFTDDVGWGCMIRSGQSLLANTLQILEFGRGTSTTSMLMLPGTLD